MSSSNNLFVEKIDDSSPSEDQEQALTVSVVIPNYNHARYVFNAIQSVLAQTFQSFEIIVVDDGSTDDSRDVITGFGNKVRYVWQENQGLGGARNTGIKAARSQFIGLLDADDLWEPYFLERMVALAHSNPEAAVCYCCAQGIDINGRSLPQQFGMSVNGTLTFYETLLRANFIIPSTVLMRRSICIANGMFDQSLRSLHGCEDWDLWLRLAPLHEFIGIPDSLVRYRLHENTFSANPASMQMAVKAVMDKHFGQDDGEYTYWSMEKKLAYGGVYRYHLLTSVQRQNNWQSSSEYLIKALRCDPTLAIDLNLFYDLALGSQPPGYRGNWSGLDLSHNATRINQMLDRVFNSAEGSSIHSLKNQAYGTAYFALGLVAYNSRQLSLSRRFLLRALFYRPDLRSDNRIRASLLKSFLGRPVLEKLTSGRR